MIIDVSTPKETKARLVKHTWQFQLKKDLF